MGLRIYRNQALVRCLVKSRISPIRLWRWALCFSIVATLAMVVREHVLGLPDWDCYVSYFHNISWSISMLVLFPAMLGLTLYFYRTAPVTLNKIYASSSVNHSSRQYRKFCGSANKWINYRYIPWLVLVVTLLLNAVYFHNILDGAVSCYSWMTLHGWEPVGKFTKSLNSAGIVAALLQIFLSYWISMFVVKALIFCYIFWKFFKSGELSLRLDPLHCDALCGLEPLSRLATLQAVILLQFGLYISLKVFDKVYMQKQALFSDIGNPLLLSVYVILAPLMFFFILGSSHAKMSEAKQRALKPINERLGRLLMDKRLHPENEPHTVNAIDRLLDLHDKFARRIPVWPFDLRSIQGFFITIVFPLVPVVSGALKWILSAFGGS